MLDTQVLGITPAEEIVKPTRTKRVGSFLHAFTNHLIWWLIVGTWGEPPPTHTKCQRPGCGARIRIRDTATHDLIQHRFSDVPVDIFKRR